MYILDYICIFLLQSIFTLICARLISFARIYFHFHPSMKAEKSYKYAQIVASSPPWLTRPKKGSQATENRISISIPVPTRVLSRSTMNPFLRFCKWNRMLSSFQKVGYHVERSRYTCVNSPGVSENVTTWAFALVSLLVPRKFWLTFFSRSTRWSSDLFAVRHVMVKLKQRTDELIVRPVNLISLGSLSPNSLDLSLPDPSPI